MENLVVFNTLMAGTLKCARFGLSGCRVNPPAALGPFQRRALAHSVHLLERSREVWAAWRALFLPHTEGAGGGFERGVAKPLCLCGNV